MKKITSFIIISLFYTSAFACNLPEGCYWSEETYSETTKEYKQKYNQEIDKNKQFDIWLEMQMLRVNYEETK